MLGPRATLEAIATVRARYGLDKPLLVQYGYYMMNLLRADFGQSLAFRTSVLNVILERLAPTLFLLAYGLVLSILLTLGLAIAAARNRGRWPDQAVRIFCVSVLGLPSFWLGLMLIILFSLRLRLFPVSGFGDSFIANLWHLFLPAVTIMLAVTPILTRNLRATMIAQISADYATAAAPRGCRRAMSSTAMCSGIPSCRPSACSVSSSPSSSAARSSSKPCSTCPAWASS
jgi:ABC-type dipeptide/oligopeptide/nickel transport systems, permease components